MSSIDFTICPISLSVMKDPVSAPCGHTFDRESLMSLFATKTFWGSTTQCPTCRSSWPNSFNASSPTNYAIRDAIVAVSGAATVTTAPSSATVVATVASATTNATSSVTETKAEAFTSIKPLINSRTFVGKNGKTYLQIQAFVPPGTPLNSQGTDYIFSIDKSGSMDSPAWVKVDKGDIGITRLDLVKHVIRTIASMLTPADRIALVTFSESAQKVMDLTPITAPGLGKLNRVLDGIYANGCTHLYGGVEVAAKIASSDECVGRRIVGCIFTDGVPTEDIPPITGGRSTMPMIQERIKVANPWSFHAIGFSSDINSRLLEQLATWGNGRMLFVPSGDMVSTNGINLTAFEKTVVSLGSVVNYKIGGIDNELLVGPLAVGQRRNYVYEIPADATVSVPSDSFDLDSVALADCRQDLVSTLTIIADTIRITPYVSVQDLDRHLMTFHDRHSGSADPSVKAILRDVVSSTDGEGQLRIALQYLKPTDWGTHYLRAYRDHMLAGVCMNFKDPGLKIFETAEFQEFQRLGDEAFGKIPSPPVQRRGHVDMSTYNVSAVFNNAGGSCFEGSMPVLMANEFTKPIRDIRRGDQVYTPEGPASVIHAIEFNIVARSQPMSKLGSQILVTPWHPYRVASLNGQYSPWTFPADSVHYTDRAIQKVYNLVLERGHVIQSEQFQFVTLGHGFQEEPLKHGFFGTEACIQALSGQPGFDVGRPIYKNCVAIKNPHTGLITGWKDEI
uniref:VWFA domain-containing protein n=1 Tax=viral metagenome TaxID=1070528 RepID=A0A6C0ARB9_9ZZZZ